MERAGNEAGFTLIEVVIALSLFVLMLLPTYALLYTGIRTYRQTEAGVNHQQNLRIAMEAITQDLRECAGLVGATSTVRLSEGNLLLETGEKATIWYYLSGEDLRWAKMKDGDLRFSGHNPVAGGISSLRFSYNKLPINESTQITIWLEGVDETGALYELSSTVHLRLD